MNKGDCFILDVGKEIYVYVGIKSKRVERLKAISAANQIRDQDHGGRAKVIVVDEYSPESEVQSFFTALGGGSQADIPDESAGGDDEKFETNEEKIVTLYRVSDSSGSVKIEQVGQKPLKQAMLDTNDCFILDTSNSNLYVWIGKKCNQREKTEAMSKAQTFLSSKKYPSWTHVQRIVEGGEPSIFQQYFQTWKTASELHTRLIRSPPQQMSKLETKSLGEAADFMPDDGTGRTEIYRVENMELVPVPEENHGKFFGGDSYVIKYQNNNVIIIYIWVGKDSTNDEKTASAMHAHRIDNELGGRATQIRVDQDHEPRHFITIFKGRLVTFLGGHASGFKNLKDHDTYVRGQTRMYRIRGVTPENVRASQLYPKANFLSSDDVFFVENDQNAWIWLGKYSDAIEKQLASDFAKILAPEDILVVINEGDEPAEFWDALGGKTEYKQSYDEDMSVEREPRLFHAILNNPNKFKLEEVPNFSQDDLIDDDVMLLDVGSVIYVWIGKGADDDEREASLKLGKEYLRKEGRTALVIYVKQNQEPQGFKLIFPNWNTVWEGGANYEEIKRNLRKINNEID